MRRLTLAPRLPILPEINSPLVGRVDLGIAGGMDLVPVSFDEKGRGLVGYTHGGTRSMMEKESEL